MYVILSLISQWPVHDDPVAFIKTVDKQYRRDKTIKNWDECKILMIH